MFPPSAGPVRLIMHCINPLCRRACDVIDVPAHLQCDRCGSSMSLHGAIAGRVSLDAEPNWFDRPPETRAVAMPTLASR